MKGIRYIPVPNCPTNIKSRSVKPLSWLSNHHLATNFPPKVWVYNSPPTTLNHSLFSHLNACVSYTMLVMTDCFSLHLAISFFQFFLWKQNKTKQQPTHLSIPTASLVHVWKLQKAWGLAHCKAKVIVMPFVSFTSESSSPLLQSLVH